MLQSWLESGGRVWLRTPGLGKRTWGRAARGGTCAALGHSVLAKNTRCPAPAESSRGRGGGTREERLLELYYSGREFAALGRDLPDSRETRSKLHTGRSLSPLKNKSESPRLVKVTMSWESRSAAPSSMLRGWKPQAGSRGIL